MLDHRYSMPMVRRGDRMFSHINSENGDLRCFQDDFHIRVAVL